MANARLVDHSNAMAKDVGQAAAHLHALRSAGIPPKAMVLLGSLEGALNRVAEHNAAIGLVARALPEEVSAIDLESESESESA